MPRVGSKHYPYTAKGQAAAKAAAKRKGVKVSHGKGYNEGGSVSKSRVNLGNAAPKRKTRKKRAVKMQAGGMAPTITPNIPNAPSGRLQQPPHPIMPGGIRLPPGGRPGGGRMPPIVKPRPPGIKKGGAVAKKKTGGGVKKMGMGGQPRPRRPRDIQEDRDRMEAERDRRNAAEAARASIARTGKAKRQLKKAPPPRRVTVRGAGGAKKGGSVKK